MMPPPQKPNRIVLGLWVFLLAFVFTVILVEVAQAHTAEESVAWEEAWYDRVLDTGLTPDLVAELVDWVDRHPEHYVTESYDGGGYIPSSWESLIIIYFESDDWAWAERIIGCESGGDPDAYNPRSGASGLFQFIPSTWETWKPWPDASPFNPTANFIAAADLYYTSGPAPWSCK